MKPLTATELCAMIVDFNAGAEAFEVSATRALEAGRVGAANAQLARSRQFHMQAFIAWERLGRRDLQRSRDMAAFARAQLGLPINDVFPARATPLPEPVKRPRFGRVVHAEIAGISP